GDGVDIAGSASGNTIGGTATGAGNVISNNGSSGIELDSSNNLVQGNFIGTNAAGSAAVANGSYGIWVNGGTGNTIGGTTSAARNLISGNSGNGIEIDSGSTLVEGNYIGTNAAGTTALHNGGIGINVTAASNTIGGTTAGSRNVVSGNGAQG